ncbi:DUF2171 domain-containing protein [Sphingomonas faeni]|uniref:DUF2171 domain-containing protein n=1 Tax=Sphingomonas faeni TaxID=185950 RepID=UPI003351F823
MAYERYTRDPNSSDYYGRPNSQDYGRDFRTDGGGYGRSGAREYEAAGEYDRDDRTDRSAGDSRPRSGNYGRGDNYGRSDTYGRDYASQDRGGRGSYGNYQPNDRGGSQQPYGSSSEYHGSYASDGRRFADVGPNRHADDDYRNQGRNRDYQERGQDFNRGGRAPDRGGQDRGGPQGGYGRQPQGYDYDDRGFIARAGDEVRSWFGDDEAERRREADARYDERYDRQQGSRSSHPHDDHYHGWRSTQIAALDRDYDEYRNENRSKFENEFSSWRTERQGQRNSLSQVTEHMEVVGSDGSHVGTVDKVKGDRILLTKNDRDAGGVHHSIPSRWIKTVDGKVTLSKSADEAKAAWKEEERNSAMFEYGDRTGGDKKDAGTSGYASSSQTGSTATGTASGTGTTTGSTTTGGTTTGTTSDTLGKSGSTTY